MSRDVSLKCPHVNEGLRDSIENFFLFTLFSIFMSIRTEKYMVPFFIESQPFSATIFYMDDQWFFLLLSRLTAVSREEKGVGKREISRADKRVRFIASLILFIDTRIALRLRSQQLRRRNSVAKLGRVKMFPNVVYSRNFIACLVHFFRTCR